MMTMNMQMLMDIISRLEELIDGDVFIEQFDDESLLKNRDESYYVTSDIILNPEVNLVLPIDITDLVIMYSKESGMDVYEVIDSMDTIVISLEDLGFKYRLDSLVINLVIVEEGNKFLVSQIVV